MIFLAPYIMAMLGRFDGNDTISRAVFLASSFLVACLSTFDIVISLAFLALAAGHRVPPTNALLPVITALPPGRRDRNIWQWMQDTSWWIADKTKYKGIDQFWTNYGLIYGVIRSLWMLPAILFMVGYAGNYWGFLALVNGVIYWWCGQEQFKHKLESSNYGWTLAEMVTCLNLGIVLISWM